MSIANRVQWFLAMPKNVAYERPCWIADDLNSRLYKLGADMISKDKLREVLLACKGSDSEDARVLSEQDVDQMLKDFFSYHEYENECNVKIFILQFTRMELFLTIRALRSKFGSDIPVNEVYRNVKGALGGYQGEKMAKHVCPDRHGETCQIEALSEFYFRYEAMLAKDAVKGGPLAVFNIEKELLSAVEDDDPQQVKLCLSHPKANPNGKDLTGQPLLHAAMGARGNPIDIAGLLLASKADPNVLNKSGQSMLEVTIEDGNNEMIMELIHYEVDVNMASTEGDKNTPLHSAAGNCNDFAVNALLKAKADPSAKNGEGQTALDVATDMEDSNIISMIKAAMEG